jgi:hypothetical protein
MTISVTDYGAAAGHTQPALDDVPGWHSFETGGKRVVHGSQTGRQG